MPHSAACTRHPGFPADARNPGAQKDVAGRPPRGRGGRSPFLSSGLPEGNHGCQGVRLAIARGWLSWADLLTPMVCEAQARREEGSTKHRSARPRTRGTAAIRIAIAWGCFSQADHRRKRRPALDHRLRRTRLCAAAKQHHLSAPNTQVRTRHRTPHHGVRPLHQRTASDQRHQRTASDQRHQRTASDQRHHYRTKGTIGKSSCPQPPSNPLDQPISR